MGGATAKVKALQRLRHRKPGLLEPTRRAPSLPLVDLGFQHTDQVGQGIEPLAHGLFGEAHRLAPHPEVAKPVLR
jgi:hypothetical protein